MSSLTLFGFLCLAAGRRLQTTKPGSPSKTYHAFYATALQSASGSSVSAEIRVYSPFNDTILPDNTVAFVVAKAFFPNNDTVLLDASHVIPMPGDPSSDDYDNFLPDCPYPFLIGLGSVPSKFELLPDGVSKTFNVISSDFIRDGVKSSTIQCAYNGSRARWSKTPAPNVNSVVQFFGTLDNASHSGDVRVNVDNIVLNVGHQDSSQPAPSSSTPVKKRKFNAFASPSASTPTPTPS
ncbi:hypothetical protein BJ138DRAFT_1019010 [Hygrophoropsis aurantiaca]|uniref:Uncharacterized protein n=1 Tax=Hygrophoropsis aurantiaca TaxID=72124 RepID=A0ACB7ZTQ5_9AGAM|nr:hypothetical protein BJ138DRAFT_1019010 [Hygrophoropsis aurantiaca]